VTHIQIILGSTRQGRVGERVANWFMHHARIRTDFTTELLDLADWPLPFFNAPVPPAFGPSSDPQTRAWGTRIAQADGYILVTPEYNHGYPAVLKNALDHLYQEWNGKPVGFVGYGGPGGGIRAVEQLRQVVVELGMVPLRQQVILANAYQAFDEAGGLKEAGAPDRQAAAVLDEIAYVCARLRLQPA
jgi:NAD(P)H-dependent FMN reductase